MNCVFLEPARVELEDAVRFYERRRKGLGDRFALAAEDAVARILRFPHTGTALSDTIRRALLKRFPYGLVYSIEGESITIVAVMHLRRKPDYWKDRL